jgi:diguanylate cyclase (GGDEF)-like protein
MFDDGTLLRLFVSQAFTIYFILLLLPLKKPGIKSKALAVLSAFTITLLNALVIVFFGISLYIRFYLLTLTLPYIILGLFFSSLKGAKFIFIILTIQVIGTVAIINGLLASYVFFGDNHPIIDTTARILTYLGFLPIVIKFIRPTYVKMIEVVNKGWWMLNSALIISYALAYFILFVPNSIFNRPEYFIHGYIGIFLSLLIYVIIFYLFIEIKMKTDFEHDKQILSTQVKSLTQETAAIKTIAYIDSLTGLFNRYSLYKQMDKLIHLKQEFIVVFIDLDKLKQINDSFDHSTGDTYLRKFSITLKKIVDNHGEVYRFAGDEFICLITNVDNGFDRENFKRNITKEMKMDVPYYGISLGLTYYPSDGLSSDDLIKLADQEMYVEKKAKQNI